MQLIPKRMAGVTTAVMFHIILIALKQPDKLFCILSPSLESSAQGFKEVGKYLQSLGIKYELSMDGDEEAYLLANGSRIVCRTNEKPKPAVISSQIIDFIHSSE